MPICIIAAFSSKNFGIGIREQNKLPWNIPEDLARFSKITHHGTVVMGRKTYESIPEERRPLKSRLNIVITHTPSSLSNDETDPNVLYLTMDEFDSYLTTRSKTDMIFIIGGESIFKAYIKCADIIYATMIDKIFPLSDIYFPSENLDMYEIDSSSPTKYSEDEHCNFQFVTFKKTLHHHPEYQYIDLIHDITKRSGIERDDRTGVGTIGVFSRQMRFDISKSVPFLTTKQLAWKSVVKELLFFLQGETDSKLLEMQGVNIWKSNTTREFLDKRGLSNYREGDMGPMYGFQWTHWNTEYTGCDTDYIGKGFNQLDALVKGLIEEPFSRRHVITTFNPSDLEKSVLMPCHGIAVQFYVDKDNVTGVKQLSCLMFQRSADVFLGLPFNIASYAVMTYIIAKKCDMVPKELIIHTGDTHIYKNHLEQVGLQCERKPFPFPTLNVDERVKTKSWDEITLDDFTLNGYLHHSGIRAPMAV